jgi:1-acyl-sn-glycerol-3-phosphate acyltransferase
MKHAFRKVHLFYCLLVFTSSFLLVFPFFLIPILFKKQFFLVGVINRWWAKVYFPVCFFPYSVEGSNHLHSNKQYIFCPNHFSYFDIPVMGLNPHNAIFVGKDEMEKIPLFGYMYRKLHITVDRENFRSRYSMYIKSQQAIDDGKSLMIFPEGGIVSTIFPRLSRFKEGAFRLAIEKQIPIVPVTIATNWIILPGDLTDMKRYPIRLIFHEPIHPDTSRWSITTLKEEVFRIIDNQLRQEEANHNKHVYR